MSTRQSTQINGINFIRGGITHITGENKTAKTTLAAIMSAEFKKQTNAKVIYIEGLNSVTSPMVITNAMGTVDKINLPFVYGLTSIDSYMKMDAVCELCDKHKPELLVIDDAIDFIYPIEITQVHGFINRLFSIIQQFQYPHVIVITHSGNGDIVKALQKEFERKSRTTITMSKKNSSECVGIVNDCVNETKRIIINTETKVCQYLR